MELDARTITGGGDGDVIRFHGYTQVGPIVWQGKTYTPWPIQGDGFDIDPQSPPTPSLSVGNVDGSITALCLAYQDLAGAVITRHVTFGQYLDGQPGADPSQEFPPDIWFIERKASESSDFVQFELSSPLDFGQQQLPGRQIIANSCTWLARGGYRGPYCGYNGPPVAKVDNTPTDDPAQDACSGMVVACKLRFGANNKLNFGGFPAAQLMNQ
ncbi:phage minor tail protein L [Dyella caseinilytica]|nr:phage minor tail protein L [Dyella caseinilytica]